MDKKCEMCGKDIPAERIARWPTVVTCSTECSQARSIQKNREYQERLGKQLPLPFPKEFQCVLYSNGTRCTGHVTLKGGMMYCDKHYWFGFFHKFTDVKITVMEEK